MPRYHFNVFDGIAVLDREGCQLEDFAAARRQGMRAASLLLQKEADRETLGEEWRVEVTDGRGMVLFRIDTLLNLSAATLSYDKGEPPA